MKTTQFMQQVIQQLTNLPAIDWQDCLPSLTSQRFAKHTILTEPGQVHDRIYFVNQGGLRSYLDKSDQDLTYFFFFEGAFATDFQSFLTGRPSKFYLQTIEDTEVLILPKVEIEYLYQKSMAFQKLGRLMAEQAYIAIEQRMNDFFSDDLETRYQTLMHTWPALFQRVPQHLIASYLGARPQSLSRIKQKIGIPSTAH